MTHLWQKETLVNFALESLLPVDKFEPPRYEKPGNILVRVGPLQHFNYHKSPWYRERREYEVLDYTNNSGVFWLQEGIGIDYWMDGCLDFPPGPGVYVIVGVYGEYIRDTWGYDDDDETWYYKRIRRAYPSEIKHECL